MVSGSSTHASLLKSAVRRESALFVWTAFGLCALLGLTFFVHRDLPMMDLPQHAVQVATWSRWSDLPAAERAELEVNLRTPYLIAYGLARAVSQLVGVVPALKLVVFLSPLGNLLALLALSRRTGHSRWLCLLALPLSFGFSFYFGFVSFLFATPLIVFALVLAFDHATSPTLRSGVSLAALLCVTLAAHGFALCISLLSVVPLLAFGPGTRPLAALRSERRHVLLLRLAPLLAPLALGLAWLTPAADDPAIYDLTIRFNRLTRWLPMLFGAGLFADLTAVALGLAFMALVTLSCGRFSRAPGRWGLFVVVLFGYAFVPEMLWNTAFLHERFVGLLLPALMLAAEPRRQHQGLDTRIAVLAAATCVAWSFVFWSRLSIFNREMADYHRLAEALPTGLRIRPLIFERDSRAIPGAPVYLHVSAYYHAERGGIPAYSFAVQPAAVIRYKRGHSSPLSPGLEWAPERFDPALDADRYDYFLVRGGPDSRELFSRSPLPIVLDACRGSFCGYRSERGARGIASSAWRLGGRSPYSSLSARRNTPDPVAANR